MANRLDVVPVRARNEGRVVVFVVLRAKTRRTIVFASRLKSGAVEILDLLAVLGREGQMEMRCLFLHSANAQRGLTIRAAKLDAERSLRDNSYTQRFERLDEEIPSCRVVADSKYDVIKHESLEVCGLHEAGRLS